MAQPKTHITARVEDRQKDYAPAGEMVSTSIALCGETRRRDYAGYGGTHYAADESDLVKITCRECSAKRAKQILDDMGAHGLTLHKFVNPGRYRDAYRHTSEIRKHGELIGYVGIEGGFTRQNWVVTTLTARDKDPETVEMAYEMERRIPLAIPRDGETYRESKPKIASKEAALVFVVELLAEGRLKTEAQIIQVHKDWRASAARREVEIAAEDAEETRINEETIAGLREIIAAANVGTLGLTNFQKSAVENALLLKYKVATR